MISFLNNKQLKGQKISLPFKLAAFASLFLIASPLKAENSHTTHSIATNLDSPELSIPQTAPFEVAQAIDASYYQQLLKADEFYEQGNLQMAARIQAQIKPAFQALDRDVEKGEAITDPAELSAAGAVYYRTAQEGLEQGLYGKTMIGLEKLTENHPNFIPGHALYAEAMITFSEKLVQSGKIKNEKEAIDKATHILERGLNLYPEQTVLLDSYIEILGRQKRYLEAAIAARQFSWRFPNHPEASKYNSIAEEQQRRYDQYLREELFGSQLAAAIFGTDGDQVIELMQFGESVAGQTLAQDMLSKTPLVQDQDLQNYVNEVGQKLARLMGRNDFKYEFFVIQNESLNAFAFPGGKIFITHGLLKEMNSEAELAGILSHELAHSVLSHGFKKMSQSTVNGTLGSILASINPIESVIPLGAAAKVFLDAEYSQEFERQSDMLGTRTLAAAGYAADGLHTVMRRFEQYDGGKHSWQSSHPSSSERVRYLEELILENDYNRFGYEGVERYQSIVHK